MTSLNFDIYLRSPPERVWAVLTDPGKVPAGRFGMSSHTDWHARHQVPGLTAEDETDSESAAGRRLTCEWLQTEHLTANGGHPSVVSFELTAMGEVTRLSLVHSHLAPGGSYLKVVAPGWPMLLSSLKSLVETGEPVARQTRRLLEAQGLLNAKGNGSVRWQTTGSEEALRSAAARWLDL